MVKLVYIYSMSFKIFNLLAPLALGRQVDIVVDGEDERLWTPDTTDVVTINLVEGVSQTWTTPWDDNGAYYPDQYIRINVNAPTDGKVRLTFNSFQTEGVGLTNKCDNDAAMVFDGTFVQR